MIQTRPSIAVIGPAVVLFVCGVGFGAIASMWMAAGTSPPPTELIHFQSSTVLTKQNDRRDSTINPTDNPTEADLLAKSLELIGEERYKDALNIYEELERSDHQLSSRYDFYHATCMAETGKLGQALGRYRKLLGQENSDSKLRSACLVAQAEVLLRLKKLEAAKSLLSGIILNSASMDDTAGDIRAAAYHLLALAVTRDLMPDSGDLLLDEKAFALPPQRAGDLVLNTLIHADANAAMQCTELPNSFLRVVSVLDSSEENALIDARFDAQPVIRILDRLSGEVGGAVQISSTARDRIANRTQDIRVMGIDLGLFLDVVLMPFQLTWFFSADGIQIIATDEADQEPEMAHKHTIAERIARHSLVAYPEHPLAQAVVLSAGNLAFAQGKLEEAESQYRNLLRMFPRSHLEIETRFNLGKLVQLTNRHVESRESFYRVIDKAPGHPLTPIAYVHVASSYLHDGRPREAIRSLNRLSSLKPSTNVNQIAGVMLASAYLISRKPRLANETLMQFRSDLKDSQFHDYAAFLAALARFQTAGSPKQLEYEGRKLVSALTTVSRHDFFREHDYYLVGLAYKELGLLDRMADLYRTRVHSKTGGRIVEQMQLELASQLVLTRQLERASEILNELSSSGSEVSARSARLNLAQIALLNNEYQLCMVTARQLLNEATPSEKKKILSLMGRVYRIKGEHYNAALCFSGMAPSDA